MIDDTNFIWDLVNFLKESNTQI